MIEREAVFADPVGVRYCAGPHHFHRPWKVVNNAAFNELKCLGFLLGGEPRKGLPQQPATQDVAPAVRKWIGSKGVETENAFGQHRDCLHRRFRVGYEE